ncbi:KH domain-containing, RNA-binding, signal transduction-associated protein 2-like isoform X1 [Rhodnius prolixus]|uniref:KH domain-containing, RNA-binding, signal transduction-associated protein 2-like isoform X1 n=1 Tax=Rhodnius prolixus TaxID=13249 RepID=UPI003D18CABF
MTNVKTENDLEMDTNEEMNNSITTDNSKSNEYIKELMKEKNCIDPNECPNAMRLLEEEVKNAQLKNKSTKDSRYVDIYREKPVKVVVKVLVPVKEHPRFNFVGKLLGPKGNSLKRLQDETMTKMAILGRGSMRDKSKEDECRATLDPKYSHLTEELHVEVAALAPAPEAHARVSLALVELKKYLVPDSNDEIRMEQLREMEASGVLPGSMRASRGGPPPPRREPPPLRPPPLGPGMGAAPPMGGPRGAPNTTKNKVLSILDRARMAMDPLPPPPPAYPDYDDPAAYGQPAPHGFDYNGGGPDYYEGGYSETNTAGGRWKGYKPGGVTSGPLGSGGGPTRYGPAARPSPYARPAK